jgi:hypothetical protein
MRAVLEIVRQDVLVDAALSPPRGLVVDDDIDVRQSPRRGLRMRCFDFPAGTNVVDVFIGDLRRKFESTGTSNLLYTVGGVSFPLQAR